jgi:hypothetical protein
MPPVTRSVDGRYVLSSPSGGHDWWEVNDMQKQYAVVTVQSTLSNAQRIAELAFELIAAAEESA